MPELVVWEDSATVEGDAVTSVQGVHQEAIVVPENIGAVRAVTELVRDSASITSTIMAYILEPESTEASTR